MELWDKFLAWAETSKGNTLPLGMAAIFCIVVSSYAFSQIDFGPHSEEGGSNVLKAVFGLLYATLAWEYASKTHKYATGELK